MVYRRRSCRDRAEPPAGSGGGAPAAAAEVADLALARAAGPAADCPAAASCR